MLSKSISSDNQKAKDIMTVNPKTITKDKFAVEALTLMKDNHITQLLVVDRSNKYIGVIHLHDLIREGII